MLHGAKDSDGRMGLCLKTTTCLPTSLKPPWMTVDVAILIWNGIPWRKPIHASKSWCDGSINTMCCTLLIAQSVVLNNRYFGFWMQHSNQFQAWIGVPRPNCLTSGNSRKLWCVSNWLAIRLGYGDRCKTQMPGAKLWEKSVGILGRTMQFIHSRKLCTSSTAPKIWTNLYPNPKMWRDSTNTRQPLCISGWEFVAMGCFFLVPTCGECVWWMRLQYVFQNRYGHICIYIVIYIHVKNDHVCTILEQWYLSPCDDYCECVRVSHFTWVHMGNVLRWAWSGCVWTYFWFQLYGLGLLAVCIYL